MGLFIHDLTEPLSIVATSANNLAHNEDRYGPLADSQKHLLNRILRNAQRAQNLVHEMIEIIRSEEGLFKREYFDEMAEIPEERIPESIEVARMMAKKEGLLMG